MQSLGEGFSHRERSSWHASGSQGHDGPRPPAQSAPPHSRPPVCVCVCVCACVCARVRMRVFASACVSASPYVRVFALTAYGDYCEFDCDSHEWSSKKLRIFTSLPPTWKAGRPQACATLVCTGAAASKVYLKFQRHQRSEMFTKIVKANLFGDSTPQVHGYPT